MSSRRRKRDSTEKRSFTSSLKRLPLGIISSFILPYLNDYDVKNACQTEIIEIQQYAYRTALWHIDEVTDINRPNIQRVREVTKLLQVKSMNKLIELHCYRFLNEPLENRGVKLLPDSLQTLTFRQYFNQPLEFNGQRLLPDGLQTLTFGDRFNHPLGFNGQRLLPDSLQTLTLGLYFNKPLEVDGKPLIPDGLQLRQDDDGIWIFTRG